LLKSSSSGLTSASDRPEYTVIDPDGAAAAAVVGAADGAGASEPPHAEPMAAMKSVVIRGSKRLNIMRVLQPVRYT
jgi:hypothetical protein